MNRLFDESVVNLQLLNPKAAALRLDVPASGEGHEEAVGLQVVDISGPGGVA